MRDDRYLGELGEELRLRVPEQRAADLVAQIAAHLDATDVEATAALGQPHDLAMELAADAPKAARRIVIRTLVSIVSFFLILGALVVATSGGSLETDELALPIVQAVLIGGIITTARGRVRADWREGQAKALLIGLAGTIAVAVALSVAVHSINATIDIPAHQIVGAAFAVVGLLCGFYLARPLPFDEKTGLTSNILTGSVKPKS